MVKEFGVDENGCFWMTIETIANGENLQSDIIAISACLRKYVLIKAAQILYRLHQAGWVHLDIKEEHILTNTFEEVALWDFGSASQKGTKLLLWRVRKILYRLIWMWMLSKDCQVGFNV